MEFTFLCFLCTFLITVRTAFTIFSKYIQQSTAKAATQATHTEKMINFVDCFILCHTFQWILNIWKNPKNKFNYNFYTHIILEFIGLVNMFPNKNEHSLAFFTKNAMHNKGAEQKVLFCTVKKFV